MRRQVFRRFLYTRIFPGRSGRIPTRKAEVNGMAKQHKRGVKLPVRVILIALLIGIQLAVLVASIYFLSYKAIWLYVLFEAVSICMVIYVVNQRKNPSYKIMWVVFILIFPLMGGVIYLFWGGGRIFPHLKKRMRRCEKEVRPVLRQDPRVESRLEFVDMLHARQSRYLRRESGFPVYTATSAEYFSPVEKGWPRLLEELEKAEHYIFIEFFILAQGKMWDSVHQILARKAAAGVDVRIIFDDFGSCTRQYRGFAKGLRAEGIQVSVFNPLRPSLDLFMNNRNHRKMVIIDGKTAISGGFNIGDEYVNLWHVHGHWMDNLFILKGDAVRSYLAMFCAMWSFITRRKMDIRPCLTSCPAPAEGFVQPYCDGPLNDRNPAEGLYMQILNTAQRYVYITTPYLILDSEMTTLLCLAAKSGIDVRIITPKIWDKWYVHPATQYSYEELLEAGVRIYEYTPGFIHSKIFVSDDRVATVGTVNMDFRSFYFHFECGTWFSNMDVVGDIKADVLRIMEKSEEIRLDKWRRRPLGMRLKQSILHLFAPFM